MVTIVKKKKPLRKIFTELIGLPLVEFARSCITMLWRKQSVLCSNDSTNRTNTCSQHFAQVQRLHCSQLQLPRLFAALPISLRKHSYTEKTNEMVLVALEVALLSGVLYVRITFAARLSDNPADKSTRSPVSAYTESSSILLRNIPDRYSEPSQTGILHTLLGKESFSMLRRNGGKNTVNIQHRCRSV
jgi:hypothetical protein